MYSSVDTGDSKRTERDIQDAVNDRQESNCTRDHSPDVSSVESSVPDQESNTDDYRVHIDYENVSQLGSDTVDYEQLDSMTMGIAQQHHYSTLSITP